MLAFFTLLMIVFMTAPLVVVVWMSFTPYDVFTLPLRHFSLQWYEAVFEYSGFVTGFWLSLRLALSVAVISTLLGFLAAYALVRYRFPGQVAFEGLFMSPLFVPAIAFGIAMLQFVNRLGIYNTFLSLLASHVAFTVPFAIRTSVAAIGAVPRELEWAAGNLGASRLRTLLFITWPMSFRGTMAGFIFAFIVSFDELTVSIFVAGPTYQTLPIRLYNYLMDQLDPTVAALSSLLIFFSILLIVALEWAVGLRKLAK
jgi:putative spermidine/putrescine transport system permease protein